MRIAVVHSSFAVRGGAERYVRDLSRTLATRGHTVRVYSRASANREPGDRIVGTRVSARPPLLRKAFAHLGDLLDPTGLRVRDLREFDPDVVHLHNWQGLGVLPVARLARAYPTCHTVHDYAVSDPNNTRAHRGRSALLEPLLRLRSAWVVRHLRNVTLLWPAERTREIVRADVPRAARLAGRIVPLAVPTAADPAGNPGRAAIRAGGAVPIAADPAGNPGRAAIRAGGAVPIAADPAGNPGRAAAIRAGEPVRAAADRAGAPGRRNVFLFMGALSPHKGIDLLLDAWREVADEVLGELLVAGDGACRAAVEAASRDCRSIRYLGYLDEPGKASALREAGWLVFPSRWAENFPISCVEALTAGRPIIASTVARPPMASDTSVVTFHDRATLAGALRSAAATSDERYRERAASAAADGARLDWDRHVDTVVRTYETMRTSGTLAGADPG